MSTPTMSPPKTSTPRMSTPKTSTVPKCLSQNVYHAKMSTPKMSSCRGGSRGSFGQEIHNFQRTFGEHLRIPYIFLFIISPG